MRIGSAITIVVYLAIAVVLLERAEVTALFETEWTIHTLAWVIFGFFAVGIVMSGISKSPAERFTMTPLVFTLAVLSLLVAVAA